MPGGDSTGPAGMGPMTGRGTGYCSGLTLPGGFHRPIGRGYGPGFGFRSGRGLCKGRPWCGVGHGAPFRELTREQASDTLQQQAAYLEAALKDMQLRIAELEKQQKKK